MVFNQECVTDESQITVQLLVISCGVLYLFEVVKKKAACKQMPFFYFE